jgi:hypothetical protein
VRVEKEVTRPAGGPGDPSDTAHTPPPDFFRPAPVRAGRGEVWIPLAVLLVVAALLFWPLAAGMHLVPFHILSGDPFLRGIDSSADRPDWRTYDQTPLAVAWAEKKLLADGLRRGELPLWNPYNGIGMPLLGEGLSQPLNPFFWPFLLWPTAGMFSVALVLQLFFGGVGMERLLRHLGVGLLARVTGAALFAFNPFTLKFLTYYSTWSYAWFPWLFLAAETAAEGSPGVGFAVASAAMGFCGHMELAFMGSASAFAYYAIRAVQKWGAKGLAKPATIVAPLGAALLSAWWIVPFLEWASRSWSPRMGEHAPVSFSPSALFQVGSELFFPPALLLLAAFALKRRAIPIALSPVLAVSVVLLFPWPRALQLPFDLGFMSGRYMSALAWFALVLLGALGLEEWSTERGTGGRLRARGSALLVLWGCLAVFSAAASGLGIGGPWSPSSVVPLSGLDVARSPAVWLGFAGAALALCTAALSASARRSPWPAVLLAACAVCGSLNSFPGTWAAWNRSAPELAPELVRHQGDPGRSWLPSEGLREHLMPNLSATFALRDVRYISPLTPERLRTLVGDMGPGFQGFLAWDARAMDFLGVSTHWELVRGRPKADPNPDALPRAFWVGRSAQRAGAQEALQEALKDETWRTTVFLESAAPPGPGPPSPSWNGAVPAVPGSDGCNRTSWIIDAPAQGWLVLRDLYWPGWKATVDGRAARLLPADGVFRAVEVPAGRHEVLFIYRPLSLLIGSAVSLLAAVALGTLALLMRRDGRRAHGLPDRAGDT